MLVTYNAPNRSNEGSAACNLRVSVKGRLLLSPRSRPRSVIALLMLYMEIGRTPVRISTVIANLTSSLERLDTCASFQMSLRHVSCSEPHASCAQSALRRAFFFRISCASCAALQASLSKGGISTVTDTSVGGRSVTRGLIVCTR